MEIKNTIKKQNTERSGSDSEL